VTSFCELLEDFLIYVCFCLLFVQRKILPLNFLSSADFLGDCIPAETRPSFEVAVRILTVGHVPQPKSKFDINIPVIPSPAACPISLGFAKTMTFPAPSRFPTHRMVEWWVSLVPHSVIPSHPSTGGEGVFVMFSGRRTLGEETKAKEAAAFEMELMDLFQVNENIFVFRQPNNDCADAHLFALYSVHDDFFSECTNAPALSELHGPHSLGKPS
jgi:hypothetical protein